MAERKDAPLSVLAGSETSTGIQASTNHLNTQKSPRFEKRMGPTRSTVNKEPEKSEKLMGSTPLMRSERDKNPVDVSNLNVKSTESAEDGSLESKKRKRYDAVEFRACCKSPRVRIETEGSEVLAHTEFPLPSGDQFWSAAAGNETPVATETADGNAESLYQHLKPTVSELCDILKFSEYAKIIVERFLKFVIGGFNVSKEHTSILQALMISVCWICSSLSKHTIDRKESLTLATAHLNYNCNEEEVDQVYEKLKKTKEMFLQNPMNLKVLNAFKDRASRPEEPRKSPAVPLNPQEQKRENHGASNEEALQSSRQILEEDIARKERNEIDKFDREWNEKKMNIVNEFELEKTFIRYLYKNNSSVRSEKLKLVEKEFANELNKHENLRQVVVNDEISLNRLANETQILDLVESEKEDQESREVAPALLGNPIEAESHDKPVHDMINCAVEDPNKNGSNDASLHADSDQMGIPAANDLTPHIEYVDGSHAVEDPNGICPNHVTPNVESAESAGNCSQDKAPNDCSADMSHVVEDPNKNGSNDTSLHADSDQMGIPAANDLTLHIEYADGSHAVEDPTGTGPNHGAPNVESAELAIRNCDQDKAQDTTPSVQQVASPFSDHSMPAIPEIHNDSNLLQQPSENGTRDQEGQADPTPTVEIEDDNMQPVEAIQVDQIIPEDSSLNPHDEPSSVISTHPRITENQAAMPSTSEVLVQTTAPPITAQAQIQLEQYLFNLQQNANSNQAASLRTGGVDPLHIELLQLSSVKEKMVKSHHDNIQKMNINCDKEIAEAIAEIKLKYCNKRLEADATFNSQKKEVQKSMYTVAMNQLLAASFRRKYQDVSGCCAAVQNSTFFAAYQAESMQQQRRFRDPSTYSPGESSGTQQTPPPIPATAVARPPQQTRPPLQIVHQTSDLFLTPLTRHPHTTNPRPANTTSIRPPPNTNPIPTIPATTTTSRTRRHRPLTIANLIIPSPTTNKPPPMINPITSSTPTTTTRPLATTTTPSPIRSPHGMNPLTSSTTPIRTSRLNPFGMSSPPWVSSVTRSTPPHMRPFVSREFRTPGPHMRPFHHVTSPSNSQRLNSPSFIQTPPPLPREHFLVPPPPQPRSESPHASAVCSPSVPQSGGTQQWRI